MKIKGNPETLRPKTRQMFYMWKERVENEIEKALGIEVMVTQIERTDAIQNAYYAQGRQPLAEVNRLRKLAGLYLIDEKENSYTVTKAKAGETPHCGFAWDYCPLKNGKLDYSNLTVINKCGQIAREISLDGYELVWGGDFNDNGMVDDKFVDRPHIQLKNWKKYR
jgi:peptidoglycan L-alanyl-D-glutamate endopeptidase CwlK